MATEAQVAANRSNAQKSTGPRTPEGKAVAAQNAVRHGFFAQEVVIKGEDPGEFEFFRDQMLEELAPAGPTESLLAARIVGLSWRLQRAERLQGAAFDTMGEEKKPAKPIWSDEAKGWIVPQPAQLGPEEQARRIVQDFGEARILDRLLVYERRIEYSLYRTMAQLEKHQREHHAGDTPPAGGVPHTSEEEWVHDTRPAANAPDIEELSCETNPISTAPRSTGILPVNLDHGRDAHATVRPDGVFTNRTDAEDQSCETNPICTAPRSTGILPVNLDHGRDAHATVRPDGVFTNRTDAEDQSCKTNPISSGLGPAARGASEEVGLPTPNLRRAELCKTNPISAEAGRRDRPIVQNEPNLPGDRVSGIRDQRTDTRPPAPEP